MKKKLFLLTILIFSLVFSSAGFAEWKEVAKSDVGDSFYIDFERIKQHNGRTYFWRLDDYKKPITTGNLRKLSSRHYIEGDCDVFRLKMLGSTFFDGPMASGKSLDASETDWSYPPPGSTDEFILKRICNLSK